MVISSPMFEHNSAMPKQYSCEGDNISPPLVISEVPENTKTFALIVEDPDAPNGTFTHWLLWNIPGDVTAIAEDDVPMEAVQGRNDFGEMSYGGPCPPDGHGEHRYFFRLYALSEKLNLGTDATKDTLTQEIEKYQLAEAVLLGRYERG